MLKPNRLINLNSNGGIPGGLVFILFGLFVVAVLGSFKSVTTHAYAVSPYSIKSGLSGNCLDVQNSGSEASAIVNNSPCNGLSNQDWSVDTIAIKHHSQCLSVNNNATAIGSKVGLSQCNADSPGQVWLADHGGLYNPNAKLCLIDPNAVIGSSLQLGNCDNKPSEQWSSPMLQLNCSSITAQGPRIACYAESDWEIWQSGTIPHINLLNTYTDNASYEEWCADFVSYVYKQAGYPFTAAYAGWDENNANNIQNYNFNVHSTSYIPSPGDVGYFSYSGGHVEIVISGGKQPSFIYGNSAIIDPTTGNGEMEANTILQDGALGGITNYLSPTSSS